ncbi:hypothetical protein CVS40_12705 [Lucilia cuprina]|nr:hypothetical protein CVS40_12705 [Lucilia cuprina]
MTLINLPLLIKGYTSSWWQGVKQEANNFDNAIELLCTALAFPKSGCRIYAEIIQDKLKLS